MPAHTRTSPYRPLALIAATPFTNSVSPTQRSASGPSGRYIAPHSQHTVAQTPEQPVEQIARGAAQDALEAVPGPRHRGDHRRRVVPEVVVRIDDRQIRLE